ncbi:hypothetical protein [Pontivivens insulae]|uniref:Lipoprotein n=1 Tax=Pontivivens insulae TaxID=1639689 RepID=A0A2R8AEU1_9RHOB|nr:hypothetical protein [Pontivivens insulae]RED11976.1 hypothetical protein DFR53_2688 [Pontivivens insulae]SPF30732.1 hypothetical protein POI8812_03074 [Pontivivens insulae]
MIRNICAAALLFLSGCAAPHTNPDATAVMQKDYVLSVSSFGRTAYGTTGMNDAGMGTRVGFENIEGQTHVCGGRFAIDFIGNRFLDGAIIYLDDQRVVSGTRWMTPLNLNDLQDSVQVACRAVDIPWQDSLRSNRGLRVELPDSVPG